MLLSDLPVGAKIADVNSKYNNKVITWTIASKNHYGSNEITLISDVLFKKSMDAKEPNQSNSRASYGNNHYSVSNLHQWLNSKKTSWYSPMHSLDAPPITENVIGTEYESEKGFMTNFSNKFLDKVKDTTFKTALHSLDGTGLETTVAKFFIPSCAEVGFGNENGLSEGKIFSLFSDSSNLKATFEGNAIGYYLRTPETTNNKYDYKIVRDNGAKYTNAACNAKVGTRVVCNIDANIEVENKTSYYKLKLSNYLNENTSLSNALTSLSNKKDDIKAMKNNLYSILSEKGIECSEADKMSSLIDKVNDISLKSLGGIKWANGTYTISNATQSVTISTNLDFAPTIVLVIANAQVYGTFYSYNYAISNFDMSSGSNYVANHTIKDISPTGFTVYNRTGGTGNITGELTWYAYE